MSSKLKTFHVTLEGPGNAVTTNKSSNQVAVAGRNVFKIYEFDVENNNFVERINLRAGKNLNLNFSSNDVAWNNVNESILATGATNGAVVIWDLQRSGRSKMDQVYPDHRRTVNTVNFHATDVNILASCSQDGTMKLFDLRFGRKEGENGAVATLHSASESVRDLQFSPHSPDSIASVQENGNVQLWDIRMFNQQIMKPQQQFTAHNGPVFSIDWHPTERKWLSTAGRDKMIKVWDIETNNRPTLEYCIQTIASVARVRWRPEQKFQIASSSLVVDFSVCVWDIRRPFIPYATFTEHKDITKGFVWINTQSLLSAGKDNTLYHHSFAEAVKPIESANPIAINIGNHGDITLAVRDDLIHHEPSSVVNPFFSNLRDSSSLTSFPSTPSSSQLVHRRTSQPPLPSNLSSYKNKRDRSHPHDISMTNHDQSSAVVSSSLPSSSILAHPTSLFVDSSVGAGGGGYCTTSVVSSTDSVVVSPSTAGGTTSPQSTQHQQLFASSSMNVTTTVSSSLSNSNQASSRHLSLAVDPVVLSSSSVTTAANSTTGASTSSIITSFSQIAAGKIGTFFKNKSTSNNNNNTVNSGTSSGRASTWYSSPSSTIDHVSQCSSSVIYYSDLKPLSMEWFTQTAISYELSGKSFDDICESNAEVCERLGRLQVANAWKFVRDKYSNTPRLAFAKKMTPSLSSSLNKFELRSREELEISQDVTDCAPQPESHQETLEKERNQQRIMSSQLIASPVIGPLRHVNGNQFIPATPARQSVPHFTYNPTEDNIKSGKRTSLSHRMSLQSNPSFPGSGHSDSGDSLVDLYSSSYPPKDETFSNREAQRETEKSTNFFFGDGDWPFGLSVQDLLSPLSTYDSVMETSKGFGSSSLDSLDSLPSEAFIQRHAIPDFPNAPLSVMKALSKGSPEGPLTPDVALDALASPLTDIDAELRKVETILSNSTFSRSSSMRKSTIQRNSRLIEFILRFFAGEGDVQSCVSFLIVLGERISFNEIDELTQEKWFTAYIDLLSRFQLWSVATQVIRLSKIPNINALNQNSTNVNLCCGVCGKLNHGNGPFTCKNCNTKTCVCAVCQKVVNGLYAWCEGCSHGGHLFHLKDWYDKNTKCPLEGCTHECEYA